MSRDIIPQEVRALIRRERDASGLKWREIGQLTGLSMREIQARNPGNKKGFRRFVIDRLAVVLRSPDLLRLSNSDVYWDEIVSVEALGTQPTYDLQIEGDHSFLANNLVVHNSHAASFALLVYYSAWLKRHEPAAFCCALLNSQPMGFYAPAQLLRDARAHGVAVLAADVNASAVESTLEAMEDESDPAIRLGLDRIKGLARETAERIVAAHAEGRFLRVPELARRAGLTRRDLAVLAAAGALAGLAGHRHRAGWAALGVEAALPLVPAVEREEGLPLLRAPTEGEDVVTDYRTLGFTLGRHPLALLRSRLAGEGWLTAAETAGLPDGAVLRTGGIAVTHQRPGNGEVLFMTLEDETGYLNLVIWSRIADRYRKAILGARLLGVRGRLQQAGEVRHVVVDALADRSALLGRLTTKARSFR